MFKPSFWRLTISLAPSLARVAELLTYIDATVQTVSSRCFSIARKLDIRRAATFALAGALLVTLADPAMAQTAGGAGEITTFLQNLVNLLTGTAGKLIAVLAICIVGIGALMGALSLRAAGGVILGVMLLFSASWIVNQITGGAA